MCKTDDKNTLHIIIIMYTDIIIMHVLMRDERRKKERSKQRQTNKQGKATQHTQGSLFLEKCASGGIRTHATLFTGQSALPAELPRQHSWLGPNLTSHTIHLMDRLTVNSV